MNYIWSYNTKTKAKRIIVSPTDIFFVSFSCQVKELYLLLFAGNFIIRHFPYFFLVLNFFWGPGQIILDSTLEFLYSFQLYITFSVLNDKTYLGPSLNFAVNIRRIQKNQLLSIPPKIDRRPMVTHGYTVK